MTTTLPTDQQSIGEFRKLCETDEQWQTLGTTPQYTQWSIPTGSSVLTLKIRYTMPGVTSRMVYETLLDQEYRKTWDVNALKREVIRVENATSSILYYQFKVPYVSNRDYVFRQTTFRDQDIFGLINNSVVDDQYPPNTNGFVRASFRNSGFLIVPSSDGCVVTNIACNDMGGSLPTFLINTQAKNVLPKNLAVIEKAAKQYEAWKQQHDPEHRPWMVFDGTQATEATETGTSS